MGRPVLDQQVLKEQVEQITAMRAKGMLIKVIAQKMELTEAQVSKRIARSRGRRTEYRSPYYFRLGLSLSHHDLLLTLAKKRGVTGTHLMRSLLEEEAERCK